MAKEFTVTLLRGLVVLFLLASVARSADLSHRGPMAAADAAVVQATLDQATPKQSPALAIRSDYDPLNFAAKPEEGSCCQSLNSRSLNVSQLLATYKVSCRGRVCAKSTMDVATLKAASRLSVQIVHDVWRC